MSSLRPKVKRHSIDTAHASLKGGFSEDTRHAYLVTPDTCALLSKTRHAWHSAATMACDEAHSQVTATTTQLHGQSVLVSGSAGPSTSLVRFTALDGRCLHALTVFGVVSVLLGVVDAVFLGTVDGQVWRIETKTMRVTALHVREALIAAFPVDMQDAQFSSISCLQLLQRAACLAVGTAGGAIVLLSQVGGSVVVVDRSGSAPVRHMAYQAMPDDTMAFVWAVCGGEGSELPLTGVMFCLKYASTGESERPDSLPALCDAEYTRDYLSVPRSVSRQHETTLAGKDARGLVCHVLAARRDPSLRYALFGWQQSDGALCLCVFDLFAMLHGATRDDARLFAPLETGERHTPLLVALVVDDAQTLSPIQMNPRIGNAVFSPGDRVGNDHRRHLPVSFTAVGLLMETGGVREFSWIDAQRSALNTMCATGTNALLAPSALYDAVCTAGLLEHDGGAADDDALAPARRRALLTLALECDEAAYICDAILEHGADGDSSLMLHSRFVLGNPAFVLAWAQDMLATLECRARVSLGLDVVDTDEDTIALAQSSAERRHAWHMRGFSWLGDIHDILGALLERAQDDDFAESADGVLHLEALRERARRAGQQLEFGSWLDDAKLLGDRDDDDGAQLQNHQELAFAEMHRFVAERRHARAMAHCAQAVHVDPETMTAVSDAGEEVPLLIDTWCSALSAPLYPFASMRDLLDVFAQAPSDQILLKQRVALYFLIDAEQCGGLLLDKGDEPTGAQFARHFGISVAEQRRVHGAWLLDAGHWLPALSYTRLQAPHRDEVFGTRVRAAIADQATPQYALLLQRASAMDHHSSDVELDTHVRVLLACGHFNEALECARAADSESMRARLLWRIFYRYSRQGSAALLHAPLTASEDELWSRFAHSAVGTQGATPEQYSASCQPLELFLNYTLARGRVGDAFAAASALRDAAQNAPEFPDDPDAEHRAIRVSLREALLDNFCRTLPEPLRNVAMSTPPPVRPAARPDAIPVQSIPMRSVDAPMQSADTSVHVVDAPASVPVTPMRVSAMPKHLVEVSPQARIVPGSPAAKRAAQREAKTSLLRQVPDKAFRTPRTERKPSERETQVDVLPPELHDETVDQAMENYFANFGAVATQSMHTPQQTALFSSMEWDGNDDDDDDDDRRSVVHDVVSTTPEPTPKPTPEPKPQPVRRAVASANQPTRKVGTPVRKRYNLRRR